MTVLFVIGTILFFLTLDWAVRKIRGTKSVQALPQTARFHYPVRVPEGIFFARSHTWLSLLPSGILRLGIDDFVGRMIEKPAITLLKHSGEPVGRGDPLFALQSGDKTLLVRSPIDGDILGVNERLVREPEVLRDLLFSDGWGYVIRPKQISQIKALFLGTETRAWLSDEFRRMGDFLTGVGRRAGVEPALMQDGGLPIPGVMKNMNDADWNEFEHEFLNVN